ncbi:MAG: LysR family transcriptional regulator [Steroidobacteraceae bacterium]|jgi:DNA-binding transcriptional LysR family regulator
MEHQRISLEQWRALQAVVEAGGYAQAATALHKSQSAVTYSVQKLERLLGVKVFEIRGRKALLTATGEVLYRRARALLEEAGTLERAAKHLAAGWEPEIRLAAEIAFPTWLMLEILQAFSKERDQTRIELYETVLSGTDEMLAARQVELAICAQVPTGFIGDVLLTVNFIAAAHPDHPLHQLGRELTLQDLRKHRQLVLRDSGSRRDRNIAWLGAEQRLTMSNKATSIHAATMGLGFAWFSKDWIRAELAAGTLKPLPLREGAERWGALYLVMADRDYAGPGVRRLAELIRQFVTERIPDPLAGAPAGVVPKPCEEESP